MWLCITLLLLLNSQLDLLNWIIIHDFLWILLNSSSALFRNGQSYKFPDEYLNFATNFCSIIQLQLLNKIIMEYMD